MNLYKKIYLIILLSFCFVLFYSLTALALETCPQGQACLDNPLGKGTTPQTFIGKVINGALGLVGSLALAMFVYGGFTWMTSGGSAERVTKGKNILIWATLGLLAIFMSYALVRLVIEGIKG